MVDTKIHRTVSNRCETLTLSKEIKAMEINKKILSYNGARCQLIYIGLIGSTPYFFMKIMNLFIEDFKKRVWISYGNDMERVKTKNSDIC